MPNSNWWGGYFKHFRQKVITTKLEGFWGDPRADIPRLEEEISERMHDVPAPRKFKDLGFWSYNRHDINHIKRTIAYMQQIVTKNNIQLTEYERYLLYIAGYGHDLGMSLWDDCLRRAYEEMLAGRLDTETMRKYHATAGSNLLEELMKPYISDAQVREAIKEIVAYHSGNIKDPQEFKEKEVGEQTVRMGLLIALLRLADTMDANEQRLPGDEIIFTSLALASTIPVFINQVQHYLRRKITIDCQCNKEGVIDLKIRRGFTNCEISSPPGQRGQQQTVRGSEAFLGVLKEFGKELGPPKNLVDLKKKFPALSWKALEETWKSPISSSLLGLYDIEIRWKVIFWGHENDPLPELKRWEKNAKTKREEFDQNPHPVEILWREKDEDKILKDVLERYRDELRKRVDRVRVIMADKVRFERLTRVFVELRVIEEYSRSKDSAMPQGGEDTAGRTFRPDELLKRGMQGIITGAPGCGKTTLLKYLTLKVLEHGEFCPIFLEAKFINEKALQEAEDLKELIFNKGIASLIRLESREKEILKRHFFKRLSEGKAFIFLDGLDEISAQGFSRRLRLVIEEFLKSEYGHTGFFLSTRPYALTTTFEKLKAMEVSPLNQEQIEEFVRHYYRDSPGIDGLIVELKEVEEIRPLAQNPFLLSIVASIYFRKGEIKTSKLDLYRDVVEQLAVQLDEEKNVERFLVEDLGGAKKLAFLKALAFERFFVDAPRNNEEILIFDLDYIEQKAIDFCERFSIKDPYDFVGDVVATPLLQETGPGRYAFFHFTLQEYLAARQLAEGKDQIKGLFCKGLFSPFLAETEVLPMALGLMNRPGELFDHLESLPESITFTNFQLRIRALAYMDRLDSKHLKALWKDLEDIILEKDPLKAASEEKFWGSLKRARNRDFFAFKIAPFLKHDNSRVRRLAAEALGKIGGERVVGSLIEALKDEDSRVRRLAAEALGKIGSERAVEPLIRALKDDASDVRKWAAEALGEIGSEMAVEALIGALKDEDSNVRWLAAETLGKIGSERVVKPLIGALKDEDSNVRWLAAETLGKIGSERVVKPLIGALKDGAPWVRREAAGALGKIGSEEAVGPLIGALKDKDFEVREEAAGALGKIGSEEAIEALIEALKDEDFWVRERAARALRETGSERGVEPLIGALKDDFDVEEEAAKVLGKIGSERGVEPLIGALKDGAPWVRWWAAGALGKIGSEEAIEALIGALKDKDFEVRGLAAWALGEIASERVVEPLIGALKDDALGVRWEAAKALSGIPAERLAPVLRQALKSQGTWARKVALFFVGYYFDDRGLLEELGEIAAKDPESEVRSAAWEARARYSLKLNCLDGLQI